ncbi:MAG: RNA polymerase-binding protein DksA [Gammaproteobacteria bacterium]
MAERTKTKSKSKSKAVKKPISKTKLGKKVATPKKTVKAVSKTTKVSKVVAKKAKKSPANVKKASATKKVNKTDKTSKGSKVAKVTKTTSKTKKVVPKTVKTKTTVKAKTTKPVKVVKPTKATKLTKEIQTIKKESKRVVKKQVPTKPKDVKPVLVDETDFRYLEAPVSITEHSLFGLKPYAPTPGEEYLNETQKNHFREILNRWKMELMQEVDRTMHHLRDDAINYPDLSDRASQEEEFNLELRTRDRERNLIWKIDEAMERLDHDEYGYCDACGVEIGIRRLEARPTATLCIDCKTLDEIREKQIKA